MIELWGYVMIDRVATVTKWRKRNIGNSQRLENFVDDEQQDYHHCYSFVYSCHGDSYKVNLYPSIVFHPSPCKRGLLGVSTLLFVTCDPVLQFL